MTRIVGGLRRIATAPGLWLSTWIGLVFIAALAGIQMRMMVAAAIEPFDVLDRGRVLFSLLDVLRAHPELSSHLLVSVLAGAAISGIAWTGLSPLLIARLAGSRPWSELGARATAHLPAVVVQSLWHLLLRAVLMVVVGFSVQALPEMWALGTGLLVWLVAGVALDATRVAVVEHGAPPFHVRSAWRGFVRTIRRPGLLVPCAALAAVQLAVSLGVLWLALRGLGSGTPWIPRLMALVSVGLGLWRLGIIVEDAAMDATTTPPDP